MKKIYYSLLLSLACVCCNAQNLVPNGDFEQRTGCPYVLVDFPVSYWFNPTHGTPDYFHQCCPGQVNVPNSALGYQQAHSGVAFGGLGLWTSHPGYREYIEVSLNSLLTAGICYHFEMYVNVPEIFKYATDDIGIYFSDTIVSQPTDFNLPFAPQIINTTGMITDSVNWVLIDGDYTAMGGENHLTIGNFNNNINTDTVTCNFHALLSYAYVYIDDVSLTPCAVGINSPNTNGIQVYPNPFSNTLTIQLDDHEPSEIILRDITAREILREHFTNAMTINTEGLAKGMYIYEVIGRDGDRRTGKVVKE